MTGTCRQDTRYTYLTKLSCYVDSTGSMRGRTISDPTVCMSGYLYGFKGEGDTSLENDSDHDSHDEFLIIDVYISLGRGPEPRRNLAPIFFQGVQEPTLRLLFFSSVVYGLLLYGIYGMGEPLAIRVPYGR